MICIRLFARLREQIGESECKYPLESPITINELLKLLIQSNERWGKIGLSELLCAINHQQVSLSAQVCPGDEVAFFPPVTGG
ncbi:MAG: Molybdopterin synthase sulfur carrier subunit [Candidatus Celerinatantimonas neptuna]|nr:MAG: Molybdopterin synthase sulfur carrier subunit [Candidatus Celerinatantimonas neptuna]